MNKILVLLIFICSVAFATDPYLRNPNIDIKQYTFQLEVNDSTDVIAGKASVTVLFKNRFPIFNLTLSVKMRKA